MAAYRFALDPTPRQERSLRSHCGAARFAYNWAVSSVRATWDQRAAEASYGVPEEELTPWRPWSLAALRKVWNQVKGQVASWWGENSKEAYNTGLAGATAAFDNYKASRSGSRVGAAMGKPRRKKKHSSALSCLFTTGTIRVEPDRHHVTLPRLGTLKTHKSTRKLAPARPNAVIGVDLGITHLVVLSQPIAGVSDEHGFITNPRHLEAARERLRHVSRKVARRCGPDRRSRREPSNRWRKANAERNRLHYRVSNLRADGLHKLTTALASHAGTLVVENLNVAGMLKNKRLARSIADAGWGTLRRLLDYKTRWRGGALHVADRWFPSSKTCSACGTVKTKLPLRVRVFHCDSCSLVLDRDLNAARNLAKLAAELGESGTGVAGHPQPRGWNRRGADRKTRQGLAGGVETSAPQRLGV